MKRILAVLVWGVLSASVARAQAPEEKSFLSLYFKDEDLVVQSATRSPRPLSQVAENMTVVTAAEIELMNAHTLADVLNAVTGVEVWRIGGPGQIGQPSVLGSENRHVTVLMDGVVMNYLGTNVADVDLIPVQQIEKIEIIKGPASSVWGSSLGGVVNIITKSGRSVDQGEVLSASYGSAKFVDLRAEARGKTDAFGYYLSAGRLQADGLTPHFDVAMTTSYLKFGYDLSPKTKVQLALDYAGAAHHEGQFPDFDFAQKDKFEHFHAALALTSAVTKDLDLEVSLHHSTQYGNADTTILSTGDVFTSKDQDKGYGGSAKLAYRAGAQTLVAGIDGDSRTETWSYLADGKQRVSKWAVNANDTIALGDLAVTPGIRYDHTSTNGSIASPSLGVTYALLKDTVLRAYVANGFNTPTPGDTFGNGGAILPNPDLKMEKVTSYQAGAETAALKYVWLKATVFRNDIRDGLVLVSLDATSSQVQNVARERQEGVELEMRTAPVFHTSLGAGAEFITTKDLDSGAHIPDVPVQVYDVSLRYDDKSSFRALLQGRHINWNAEDWELSKYHSLIIDLTAAKKLYQRGDDVVELFAGGHNLLNTPQYNIYIYQNPARWYEIGLRYTF